ncbi:MAG: MFS transporter [Oscillospiraceae bacterium]|jgi:MFS family permease|nr:MFS transporter [Oscillospiraceae bacterium]
MKSNRQGNRAVWLVTFVVFAGMALFAMGNNGQGVLLSSFIDAFSLESGMQGVPNATANLGVMLAMLLAMPLASRFGKLSLFLIGLSLMAVMLSLAGAAHSAIGLIAAYCACGFGFGLIDTCASSIVADLHQGGRAPMLMGMLHAVYGLGGILAPVWMTALLASGGAAWRVVLWILGGLSASVFVAGMVVVRRVGHELPAAVSPPGKITRADLLAFARQNCNVLLICCAACYCAHQSSLYLWISRVIGVGYDNPTLGAVALSLFWVGTVASRLLVPLLRVTAVSYVRIGMLATAAAVLFGALVGGAGVLCAVTALAGLLGGATLSMLLTEMTRRNPDRSMLAITAILLTTAIAAIICAPLIGFIVGQTSLIAGMFISGVFAVGCAGCMFGVRHL